MSRGFLKSAAAQALSRKIRARVFFFKKNLPLSRMSETETAPQPVAIPAAEKPIPIDVDEELPAVVKKLKGEAMEGKCTRCKGVYADEKMENHSCRPIYARIDRFADKNNYYPHSIQTGYNMWMEHREKYPYPGNDIQCKRCSLCVTEKMLKSHTCNPRKGNIMNYLDYLSNKYDNKALVEEEVRKWCDDV